MGSLGERMEESGGLGEAAGGGNGGGMEDDDVFVA